MPEFWHRSKKDKRQERSSDAKQMPASKLGGAKPMRFEADDERPSREDREAGRDKSKNGFPSHLM
jgi:hypothetical protein